MTINFEYLDVPKGDKAVYGLAEAYFVERLTAHFRSKDYDCYREYEYAGGSTFMPTVPTISHTNSIRARILRMLQGGDDAFGFRFLKPKIMQGRLKERGFQKPDFLAFREYDGVIGEIGTANMRTAKIAQLNGRLRDLEQLVQEEVRVLIEQSAGKPLPWHGMTWKAAPFHPTEGPVVIPVDQDRLISTIPTFEPKTDGLYLYQLLRYQRHQLPVGDPVAVPRLSPQIQQLLKDAWQRYQKPDPQGTKTTPNQPGWFDGWPSLRKELLSLLNTVALVVVVVAIVALLLSAFSLAATVTTVVGAFAGFAAFLLSGLSNTSPAPPGTPMI
jgi:hypothetical protein